MPYIDEIELGDEIGPVEKVATDEDVANFCDVWDAPKPNRFTDDEVAAKSGMPGAIKDLDLVFRQPVPHNRTLTLAATITDVREEDGEHLVECDILMTGPAGERYIGGTALISVPIAS